MKFTIIACIAAALCGTLFGPVAGIVMLIIGAIIDIGASCDCGSIDHD